MKKISIDFHGDSTLILSFGEIIDEKLNIEVHRCTDFLNSKILNYSYIIDIYPTYNSIVIDYDPQKIFYEDIKKEIEILLSEIDISNDEIITPKIINIPVKYGGDHGPDLERMSQSLNISQDEIIKIHSSKNYRVYMLGFMPGFPYLGGLDKKISFPRLNKPRLSVPSGSVGIAGDQTGVYPFKSPGGWNIIGKTKLKLFDKSNDPPNLITTGSYIKFTIDND